MFRSALTGPREVHNSRELHNNGSSASTEKRAFSIPEVHRVICSALRAAEQLLWERGLSAAPN